MSRNVIYCIFSFISILLSSFAHCDDRELLKPIFDADYYRAHYSDDIKSFDVQEATSSQSLGFFVGAINAAEEVIEDLFHIDHCKHMSDDELLDYFMSEGWQKGHNPNDWFDTKAYQKYYPTEMNPVLDWMKRKKGTTKKKESEELIVSLTTHPPRIHTSYLAIESLLRQSQKPNRIILFLAEDDFPDRKIPANLEILRKRGLEVIFSKRNYKVATKLIPALKMSPEATIITIDDDRIYHKGFVQALWAQHRLFPQDIISPSARKYSFDIPPLTFPGGEFLCVNYLAHTLEGLIFDKAQFGIFEGFSGVLYPPHALDEEVRHFENFKHLTPYADDIWFQIMAILKGTKSRGLPEEINKLLHWPQEIDGTQEAGLFRFHLPANDFMLYNALQFYGVTETIGLPKLRKPHCKICRRELLLAEHDKALITPRKNEDFCKACFNPEPKKILCVGAYDYGNIGDGSYKLILEEFLKKRLPHFDIHFIPNTVRINQKGEYIGFRSEEKDLDFDFLIIGGGGILKQFSPKDDAIRYYTQQAQNNAKPYFFISVGLQTSLQQPDCNDTKEILGDTVNILKKASLLIVRSVEDYSLLNGILGKSIKHKIFQFPDLGFLMPHLYPPIENVSKKYVTLIQTGSANIYEDHVIAEVNQLLQNHHKATLVVMNWGGVENPSKEKDFKEWDLFDQHKVREQFPQANKIKVYRGNSLSEELIDLRYKHHPIRQSDLTPKKAVKIIQKSHHVITGRYHGKIFADAYDIPCTTPCFTYKLVADANSHFRGPTQLALRQIDRITSYLKRDNGIESDKSPDVWDDNDRNSAIVKIHAENSSLTIRQLQAMHNNMLYQYIVFGRELK